MPGRLLPRMLLSILIALSMLSAAVADPTEPPSKHTTESLATLALEAGPAEAAIAVAELRSRGPEGLRAFLEANRSEIDAAAKPSAGSSTGDSLDHARSARSNQVLATLDSICKQKDCFASRLYWYTDLDKAKATARAQGKPILSLRLLGRLDEDLSCANSRLFRIVLYANEQVSELLRERFVLHWQSVRPVPTVTIDFGDGRKMERTLTGNSIHYVLDSKGRLIDALPGLYGPVAFLRELERILSAAAKLDGLKTDEERQTALVQYHQSRLNELETAWIDEVKRVRLPAEPSREIPKPTGLTPPRAQVAAAAGISKAVMIERPVLRGMSDNPKVLDSIGSDAGWSMIARLHMQDAEVDDATRALMSFKDPSLTRGSLQLSVILLQQAIAEDTVRNEYVFRARIHRWLAEGTAGSNVEVLNEKIYDELFLTPSWDAWLGLRPTGAYSGIDNDGVRK
ncbi:MAG TPA: hypothetical protein VFB82_00295 [Blastocatellia bacterium]|nr:hypothetical protein [Blastocatellia bacterium]